MYVCEVTQPRFDGSEIFRVSGDLTVTIWQSRTVLPPSEVCRITQTSTWRFLQATRRSSCRSRSKRKLRRTVPHVRPTHVMSHEHLPRSPLNELAPKPFTSSSTARSRVAEAEDDVGKPNVQSSWPADLRLASRLVTNPVYFDKPITLRRRPHVGRLHTYSLLFAIILHDHALLVTWRNTDLTLITPAASCGKHNVIVWRPSVRRSVCPVGAYST